MQSRRPSILKTTETGNSKESPSNNRLRSKMLGSKTFKPTQMCAAAGVICTGILLLFSLACSAVAAGGEPVFDVVRYGARGDGVTDDTKAFKAAWAAACRAEAPAASMLVPAWRTFLVGSVDFHGPCTSQKITVQVMGAIVAPPASAWWGGRDDHWLKFSGVDGLRVTGNGVLDGNGQSWWVRRCSHIASPQGCVRSAPTALKLEKCNNLELSGFSSKNSPQMHIAILDSRSVNVERLTITAPGNSPNTDGIHVGECNDVRIIDSNIGTGDDCVSIGSGSRFITVHGITCGPGHGVSVGSLGKYGKVAAVEYVDVSKVHFINTKYGARIKTWQGGQGHAKSISFTDIEFSNVDNPVLINQFYHDFNVQQVQGAVAISNVTYSNLRGTSAQATAVAFECSSAGSCTEIRVSNMRITREGAWGGTVVARCQNAQVDTFGYVYPEIHCLREQRSLHVLQDTPSFAK